jgi:RNA polymerase sigma factor (sigma-70 family)
MTEDTLVQEALHLPRREAARWNHTPFDQEELVADGNLGLVRAARRFDPTYGVPFAAFATPFVRGAIVDAIAKRVRRHAMADGTYARVVGFSDVGWQVEEGESAYEPPHPGPSPHDRLESLERLRTLATLPTKERIALVRTIVDGDPAAVVADDLGVSPNRVYTLVHAGSARLRRRAA